jgi:hypothetical protein
MQFKARCQLIDTGYEGDASYDIARSPCSDDQQHDQKANFVYWGLENILLL